MNDIIDYMKECGGDIIFIYHGSATNVSKPDIIHSRNNVVFGKGFYAIQIKEQVSKWAARYKLRHGVANDKVFNTIELFFDGLIDKKEAIKRLQYEKPNMQICIRNQDILD